MVSLSSSVREEASISFNIVNFELIIQNKPMDYNSNISEKAGF